MDGTLLNCPKQLEIYFPGYDSSKQFSYDFENKDMLKVFGEYSFYLGENKMKYLKETIKFINSIENSDIYGISYCLTEESKLAKRKLFKEKFPKGNTDYIMVGDPELNDVIKNIDLSKYSDIYVLDDSPSRLNKWEQFNISQLSIVPVIHPYNLEYSKKSKHEIRINYGS